MLARGASLATAHSIRAAIPAATRASRGARAYQETACTDFRKSPAAAFLDPKAFAAADADSKARAESIKLPVEVDERVMTDATEEARADAAHDHFVRPRNAGTMDKKAEDVGSGLAGTASRGGVIQIQIQVEGGVIKDAKFKTLGCNSIVACSSFATESILGKSLVKAENLTSASISAELKLSPSEVHLSSVARDAVRKAVANYRAKHRGAIQDHFAQPRNMGTIDKQGPDMATAPVGKASRGGLIYMQLRVQDEVIQEAKFKAIGCSSVVASGSYVTEAIIGMSVADVEEKLTSEAIASLLQLPAAKAHSAALARDAACAAAANYMQEHGKVHMHFFKPCNVGELDKTAANVGFAIAGQVPGDFVQMYVNIEDGIIKDAKFKAFGCDSLTACCSYATAAIIGSSIAEAGSMTSAFLSEKLKLPPTKVQCSMLARDAVRKSIADYKSKQGLADDKASDPVSTGLFGMARGAMQAVIGNFKAKN